MAKSIAFSIGLFHFLCFLCLSSAFPAARSFSYILPNSTILPSNQTISSNYTLSGNSTVSFNITVPSNTTSNNGTFSGIPLRILPLGDSITLGYLSTTGNGYRQDLIDLLSNNSVDYIGTQKSGNMTDPDNEGHSGAVISTMLEFCNGTDVQLRPNVILLMAGSNDINGNINISGAPARLSTLIDNLAIFYPESALIVAELTPSGNTTVEANVKAFNGAIPGIVAQKQALGEKVLAVNMTAQVSTDDLKDGLHPNDKGYQLMANVWLGGLEEASAKGWINPPIGNSNITTKIYH